MDYNKNVQFTSSIKNKISDEQEHQEDNSGVDFYSEIG
jgi:hypothetical protein